MSQFEEVIKNENDEVVNIGKDIELAKLILETTKNNALLSMLFGYELDVDVTAGDLAGLLGGYKIVKAIKSIINTAFLVALTRWKQLCENNDWVDTDEDYSLLINSRYSKLFQSVLDREELTLDLQVFALTELWVSLKNSKCNIIRDEFGLFAGRKEGESIGITLQQALNFAKNASFLGTNNDGKYCKYNCNFVCIKLLRAFSFFENLQVELPKYNPEAENRENIFKLKDSCDFKFIYKLDKRKITLYPNKMYESYGKIIITGAQLEALKGGQASCDDPTVSPYMLVGVSGFNGTVHYAYRSFDGGNEYVVSQPEKSDKDKEDKGDTVKKEKKQDSSIIRKFMSFNYKNIREFALVISDAIKNTELPQKLFEKFTKSYKKNSAMFGDLDYSNTDDVYLDYIITLMLVEMGPSEFLEQILGNVRVYNDIMENIGWRCIGRKEKADYEKNYQKDIAEIKNKYPLNNKLYERRCLELRVNNVVKAMGFDGNEDTDAFEESLSSKYDNITDYVRTLKNYKDNPNLVDNDEYEKSKQGLKDIFKDMFIFMNVFYRGTNAYAQKKKDILEGKNADESNHKQNKDMDEEDKIKMRRRRCIDSFIAEGAKTYAKIKDYGLTQAYESFCDLCRQYNTNTSDKISTSKHAENLKFLITRNYICDVTKLEYFASIKCDDGEKTTIFYMLEHYGDKYYKDSHFKEWLDYFKDVFFFLIYNDDYNKRGLFESGDMLIDKDCDPVYPYMVNYHKENTDRDNLKKCTYRVPVPVKNSSTENLDKGFDVNLLTEERYPPCPHFCIPLKYGSTDNWWINPFMVPRRIVKGIKKEAKNYEPYHD